MSGAENPWLALDVGGANLKAAHQEGGASTLAFPLWKRPDDLPRVLQAFASQFPDFVRVALTMTGELCDCFETRADGVRHIVRAVEEAFPGRSLWIYGVDGSFHGPDEVRSRPMTAAAANWVALANVVARRIPAGGVLIDVGSTTTDLIPLQEGRECAIGRTDTERLANGELVYLGVRRTPLCALVEAVPFRGQLIPQCAELFATTLDVFLTLGDLPEDPFDTQTADGRRATRTAARDRLARTIGLDRSEFLICDTRELAIYFRERLIDRLSMALRQVLDRQLAGPFTVVVSGSGEFLAREVAGRFSEKGSDPVLLEPLSLGELWGPAASEAACARALLELAGEIEERR